MDKSELDKIYALIVRYASLSNGVALTLSLTAMSKFGGNATLLTTSKFPVWCFFIGLILSGLFLFVSLTFQLGREAHRLLDEIQRAKANVRRGLQENEELRAEAREAQPIDMKLMARFDKVQEGFNKADEDLDQQLQRLSQASAIMKPELVSRFGWTQESLLMGSYLFFVIGAATAISKI